MCYLLLAIDQSKDYPFILAANRDEYYQRKSSQLGFWPDKPKILGGRDIEQGGTWMAVSLSGRFAAITNYREAGKNKPSRRSRGLLISDFLDSDISVAEFSHRLYNSAEDYNGFNLIYGLLPRGLYYFSNRNRRQSESLSPGIYGLSNHLLDTPWPKIVQGKIALKKILRDKPDRLSDSLFSLLNDRTKADENKLPDTGIEQSFEHLLSSIYIQSERYGTRCSSVLMMDTRSHLDFTELTFGNEDLNQNPHTISITLPD